MNSFPMMTSRSTTNNKSRSLKALDAHKQVWRVRHDEDRRRWNRLPKSYRNTLLATF